MKAVLVFLGFAVACVSAHEPDLKVRFDIPIWMLNNNDGSKFFMPQPTNRTAAEEKGWQVTPHPEVSLPNIELWCDPQDYRICVYLDTDTGYCTGIQIAVPKNDLSKCPFDLTVQGWVEWTPCDEGETYWVQRLFVVSEEFLNQSAEDRLANYDPSSLIQDNTVLYTGFHGALDRVPADQEELERTSDFTKQACIPLMGRHYYYRMTPSTQCRDSTMYPWFPLVHDGKIIGSGLIMFGKMATLKEGKKAIHEYPSQKAVEIIVNSGPKCLIDKAGDPGVITTHIYFIKNPLKLWCLKN